MGGKDKELQRDRILDMTIFLMIFYFLPTALEL